MISTRTLSRSFFALSLVLGGTVVGCGNRGTEEVIDAATEALVADGTEAVTENDTSTGALVDLSFETASADPQMAASALSEAPADPLDGKCRSRAKDPNDPATVIITLTSCTGRFGQHEVSGTEIVHFSTGGDGVIHADFHSENLTFDGKPASHTASADVTITNDTRTVSWQGVLDREGKAGIAVHHTSDLTIDVEKVEHCRTRNGTATTAFGPREVETTFSSVRVCREANGKFGCPTGEVTHKNRSTGKMVTIQFDGSNQATITGPGGKTVERTLACGE